MARQATEVVPGVSVARRGNNKDPGLEMPCHLGLKSVNCLPGTCIGENCGCEGVRQAFQIAERGDGPSHRSAISTESDSALAHPPRATLSPMRWTRLAAA